MKQRKHIEPTIIDAALAVEENVESVVAETDRVIAPWRRVIERRYPAIFLLTVTFGVAAVFFGFERVLAEIAFLNERPWIILVIGIVTLIVTGRLYKKLS